MRTPRSFARRARLVAVIAALAIVIPGPALGAAGSGSAKPPKDPAYRTTSASYVATTGAVPGVTFQPLINSGETAFGTVTERFAGGGF